MSPEARRKYNQSWKEKNRRGAQEWDREREFLEIPYYPPIAGKENLEKLERALKGLDDEE